MVLPAFPFNVLGSVLARTRVVALRRVGAEEKLTYRCGGAREGGGGVGILPAHS